MQFPKYLHVSLQPSSCHCFLKNIVFNDHVVNEMNNRMNVELMHPAETLHSGTEVSSV